MANKKFVVSGVACRGHSHCAVHSALTALRQDLLALRQVEADFTAMVATEVRRASKPSSKHLFSVRMAGNGDVATVLQRLRVFASDFVNSYATRPGFGVITLGGIRRARGGGLPTGHQAAVESV